MLQTIEMALVAKLANAPEFRADRNENLVVVLHLLCDTLGKGDGKSEPAWCRTTVFRELTQKARGFRKGDQIFARVRRRSTSGATEAVRRSPVFNGGLRSSAARHSHAASALSDSRGE